MLSVVDKSSLLACRLRCKEVEGRNGRALLIGEVDLENIGKTPVEIEYRMTLFQYLHLEVRDTNGKIVSEGCYGERYAPSDHAKTLHIAPGETVTGEVYLLATVPKKSILPGNYSVQAIYEYMGFRAVSEPVQVIV